MTHRPQTLNAGAAIEREAITDKLARDIKKYARLVDDGDDSEVTIGSLKAYRNLRRWIAGRTKRNVKPGGLGRK